MFNSGSIVTVAIGATVTRCLVVAVDDQELVLVPLALTSDLHATLSDPPVSLTVSQDGGEAADLFFSGMSSVPCIRASRSDGTAAESGRMHYRVHAEFRATINVGPGSAWHVCSGENISEGGMLLANSSKAELSSGQRIRFCIHLSGAEAIRGVGVVVRVMEEASVPERFAVQFTAMSASDSRALVRFLYQQQARSPRAATDEEAA